MNKKILFAITFLLINSLLSAQTFNSILETSYGGNKADKIYDLDKSDNGSIVVAGLFGGTVDFDPGPGTYNLTSNGTPWPNNTIWGGNGFIQKFDASGNLDWAVANLTGELYSSNGGQIQEVEFDPTNNIIVKAWVRDSVDIDPGPGQILTPASITSYSHIGVIQKLNGNTGVLDWAITIDASFRMVVDQNGDVLIAGTYQDSVDLDPGSGTFWMDPLANNSAAPFAAKYSGVDGSFLWGADFDFAATGAGINSIDVDNTGRLILGGYYRNQILVNPDAPAGSSIVFTAPNQNYNQGFMIILNSDGTHSASRNFGFTAGNNSTTTYNVAFDDLGYYYVGTTLPDLSTVIAEKLIKYNPTSNSPVWTVEIRTNYVRMDVIGDGEIYLHGKLAPGGSVDIDPSSNIVSPNFTIWKPIIMKWDGSSSPFLDWYKPFGDDNLKTFVIDAGNNENISIAADFKETMTPNISSSDSFSVVTCTPNNANLCYDMYLNFASVCSDTTFANANLNVCSGSNYTFSDGTTFNNITANFNHTAYTTSAGGCDSAVTYAVQAISHPTVYDTVYVCVGDSHTFHSGLTLQITGNATVNSFFTSSLGCDSLVQTYALGQTAPVMTAEVSCNTNEVTLTVTDMGTHQSNPSPPFDIYILDLNQTHTITGVGTYTFPISNNMLSGRIVLFEPNNCADDIYYYNTCDQSICAGNNSSNLLNGDFENLATNWTQFEAYLDSTNSGYLPITAQTLGNNRAFNYSTTSTWFGGWNQGSYNSISQNVVIDAGGSATLEWWQMQQGGCALDDIFTVLIDGDTVYELQAFQDSNCGSTSFWNFKSVDVSAYADGMSHNVMFHYIQLGSNGYTNLFIDNIDLYTCPVPPVQMDLPVTFDDATVNYATADFGGNASMFVNDPTGGTNQVVQSTKSNTAQTWAGTTLDAISPKGFLNAIPFTATETVMSVRVYSPDAGIPVLLKVEDKTNNAISVETQTLTSVANAWETLYFDFNNNATGTPALNVANTYDLTTIFFNFGTDGATAGTKTYYWDDVMMSPCTDTVFTYETINVCSGDDVLLPDGTTYYNVTFGFNHNPWYLTAADGCDSVVVFQVQAIQNANAYDTVYVCSGANYTFPDGSSQMINAATDYTSNLQSSAGCDSAIETHVALDIEMDISAGFNNCQVNPNQIRVIVTDMGTINGQPSPAFQATIDGVSQTITGPGTYYFTTSIADASYQLFLFSNNCHPDITVYNNCYQGTNYCATSSAQLIQNSNFENTVTVGWTEFATFLDSTTNTNNGVISGSNGGTYNDSPLSAKFGGYSQGSYHAITHTFFISPNETSELSWYQRQTGACDAGDLFEVKIDGQTIFSQTADQDPYCNGDSPMWTLKKMDITPYATGGVHQFEMFYQQLGTNGYTNLFVDDVRIYSCPCPTIPTTYDTTYICSGASHTWPDGSSLNLFANANYTSTLTSSQGCDSIVQSTAIIETVPTMSGEISCTGNTVEVTVTDMGTYQGNVAPPFDVSVEGTFYTIPGVGTYTYPITDNMLSIRIPVFEANNCAQDLWLFNNCEQSICPSNDISNLLNGDFENTTVTWTQFEAFLDSSSSGYLPITTPGLNRTYNNSTTSVWFGGWNQGSYNSISQDLIIDAGTSATLEWWQRQENGCAADDVLTVLIDGDTVFELQADQDPYCGTTGAVTLWNFKSVDVSAYADGLSHNVMFHYTQIGTNGYTNLFIDNIDLYTCPVPLTQMDLPVTFDDPTILYATDDFSGNASAFVGDPAGGSNLVVETTKSNTALTYAGTTLDAFTPSGFLNAIPFTVTETVMSVRVYSPDAGIPVLLKVEDKTNSAISVETEVMTTMVNTWETLYFDFNNNATGTPALNLANTYDLTTIFFNFGTDGATAGTKTYYWDDVKMDTILCPVVTTSYSDTICFFDSYTFPDGNTFLWGDLPQDTIYESAFDIGNGCDSLVYTNFHKRPNSVGAVQFIDVCYGDDFTYLDGTTITNVTANGGRQTVLTNQFGCDSSQLQLIFVKPEYMFLDTVEICQGSDYTAYDGTIFTNVQTNFNHTSILSSVYGCDSTYQTTVEVLPSYTVNTLDTICYNESYTFPDGITLNSLQIGTLYVMPNTAQNGCDSSITVDLYVRPNSQSPNTTHTVCSGDDFTFQDGVVEMNVTSNVVHLNTFTNQYGCDSTFIQFINTVNPVYSFNDTIDLCYGTNYTAIDGTIYGNVQAGFNHTSSFTTVNGCDSNYLAVIQVLPDYTTSSVDTICYNDSYTFPDGVTLNNLQTDTLYVIPYTTAQNACDSSTYVNLHVRPNSQGANTSHTVCSGDNFTYQDGTTDVNITTYTAHLNTFTNQFGCDSTFIQDIFVNPVYSSNDTVNICQGSDYTAHDGTMFNNIQISFNHTSSLTTQNSCDSIYETQVNVSPTYATTTLDTICFDASYTFTDGNTLNNLQEDTLYVTSFTTQNGCDSIISVDVIVRPALAIMNMNASICSGGSFTYIDGTVSNNITTAESYTNTFTSSLGCDSLVIENVAVTPSYLVQDSFDVCFGDDFTFADGTTLTIANDFTYTSNLTAAGICDSIIETTIHAIGLSGTIQSSTAQPLANSTVYLIEHLPGQDYLFIQDSTTTNANGEYSFDEGDANHFIKAIPSSSFPNDLPSYYLSSTVFQYSVEADCSNSLNFATIAGQDLGGLGFISGFIGDGAGKNSEIGNPLSGLALVLVDASGVSIARVVTDANGYFIFEDLTCGAYEIWLDDALTNNNLAPLITLADACIQEDLQLVLMNNRLYTPVLNSIAVNKNKIEINVFPNPTEGEIVVNFNQKIDKALIKVYDIAGKEVNQMNVNDVSKIDLELGQAKGAYILEVNIEGSRTYLKILKK